MSWKDIFKLEGGEEEEGLSNITEQPGESHSRQDTYE